MLLPLKNEAKSYNWEGIVRRPPWNQVPYPDLAAGNDLQASESPGVNYFVFQRTQVEIEITVLHYRGRIAVQEGQLSVVRLELHCQIPDTSDQSPPENSLPTTLRTTLAPLPTTARNIVGNGGNLNMNTKCVLIIKWFWFFNNCEWIILVYSFMNKVYLVNKFLLDVSVDKFWLNTFVNDRNLSLRYLKTISLTSSSTHTCSFTSTSKHHFLFPFRATSSIIPLFYRSSNL